MKFTAVFVLGLAAYAAAQSCKGNELFGKRAKGRCAEAIFNGLVDSKISTAKVELQTQINSLSSSLASVSNTLEASGVPSIDLESILNADQSLAQTIRIEDSQLNQRITSEQSRALAAEVSLQNVDRSLDTAAGVLGRSIATEKVRAETAEAGLEGLIEETGDNLDVESVRRINADVSLTQRVAVNQQAISDAAASAENFDAAISSELDAAVGDLRSGLASEVVRAGAAESSLETRFSLDTETVEAKFLSLETEARAVGWVSQDIPAVIGGGFEKALVLSSRVLAHHDHLFVARAIAPVIANLTIEPPVIKSEVLRCADIYCTSTSVIFQKVFSISDQTYNDANDRFVDLAINPVTDHLVFVVGGEGIPAILYNCDDDECTSYNAVTLPKAGSVDLHLTVDAEGSPIVTYLAKLNAETRLGDNIEVVYCFNTDCEEGFDAMTFTHPTRDFRYAKTLRSGDGRTAIVASTGIDGGDFELVVAVFDAGEFDQTDLSLDVDTFTFLSLPSSETDDLESFGARILGDKLFLVGADGSSDAEDVAYGYIDLSLSPETLFAVELEPYTTGALFGLDSLVFHPISGLPAFVVGSFSPEYTHVFVVVCQDIQCISRSYNSIDVGPLEMTDLSLTFTADGRAVVHTSENFKDFYYTEEEYELEGVSHIFVSRTAL